jgi:sortase A
MVRGHIQKPNTNIIVIALAIAFVLYHLGQYTFAPVEWAKVILPQATPVVQPKVSKATSPSPLPANQAEQMAAVLGLQAQASQWPTRVTMPSAAIDLTLDGSMEQAGSWVISETGANFALNTAIPNGQTGNTVLFGHDRPKLFHDIHQLKPGDAINILTAAGTYTYKMTSSTVVEPSDVSVMNQTDASTITLLTCDGWLSQNRYVVVGAFDHFTPVAVEPSVESTDQLALR